MKVHISSGVLAAVRSVSLFSETLKVDLIL